jgi:hypothetical protein
VARASRAGVGGRNTLRLRKRLRPGRYALIATAVDAAGNRARPVKVRLRIRRRSTAASALASATTVSPLDLFCRLHHLSAGDGGSPPRIRESSSSRRSGAASPTAPSPA